VRSGRIVFCLLGFRFRPAGPLHARHRPPRCCGPCGLANFSPSRSLTLPGKLRARAFRSRDPLAGPYLQCPEGEEIGGDDRKEDSPSVHSLYTCAHPCMTASISAARSSSVPTCGTGSDNPTPAFEQEHATKRGEPIEESLEFGQDPAHLHVAWIEPLTTNRAPPRRAGAARSTV
jgi:hypothetical protein